MRRFIKITKPFTDEDWSAEEARELGNIYYDAYQEGSASLLRLISQAIVRVEMRQQEQALQPDIESLIDYYAKERSYGRSKMLRNKLDHARITPEIIEKLDALDAQFNTVLNEKNTQHFARAKSQSNLAMVKQRAGLLFKHKKRDELQDLLSAVDKHNDQAAATPYRQLVTAYLAELDSASEQALTHYHALVDGGELLLEEALTRIAAISIEHQDTANAQLALDCLSQMNPLYLPFYAEMLRLQGEAIAAIDVYMLYINQFPSDTAVQMKLVALYLELNVTEAADMLLDHMLQQKPDLEAALLLKQRLRAVG